MSAKIIVMQGNMVATIEETNKDAFIKRGEYKETELDRHKREVDFLITSIANRYEVTFNHKVELKESRSIKKSEYFDNIYYVTENALNKLKSNTHTSVTCNRFREAHAKLHRTLNIKHLRDMDKNLMDALYVSYDEKIGVLCDDKDNTISHILGTDLTLVLDKRTWRSIC